MQLMVLVDDKLAIFLYRFCLILRGRSLRECKSRGRSRSPRRSLRVLLNVNKTKIPWLLFGRAAGGGGARSLQR